jgi:hypothetical protein
MKAGAARSCRGDSCAPTLPLTSFRERPDAGATNTDAEPNHQTPRERSMADSQRTPNLSVNEIRGLADRLSARADSVLSDQPETAGDLRNAAWFLRYWVSALRNGGAI